MTERASASQTPTSEARQRLAAKLRTFYKELPADEQQLLEQLLMASDVHGASEDAEYGVTVTMPTFEGVITTRLLEVPEFERVASHPDAVVDSVQPEITSQTAIFERNT